MAVTLIDLPVDALEANVNWGALVQDNVTTHGGALYPVWWDSNREPIIGKLVGSTWETFNLAGVAGNPLVSPAPNDTHNTLAVAVDIAGHLHVAGNMHADPMRYVRSANPADITSWVSGSPPGGSLTRISYAKFVRTGSKLLLFFRDGSSSSSDEWMQEWTGSAWTAPVMLISGVAQGEGMYLNHVGIALDGAVHVGATWRDGSSEAGVYNDISHMVSRDGGTTWEAMDGTVLTLPVTHTTMPLVFDSVDSGSGLINGPGLDVDDAGFPHLIQHVFDSTGPSRLLHSRWTGASWLNEQVMLDWQGRKVSDAITQPSILCNAGRVFVIYRNDLDFPPGQIRIREITDGDGPDAKLADVPEPYVPTFDTRAEREANRLNMLIPPGLLSLPLSQVDALFGGPAEPGGLQPVGQAKIRTRMVWLGCDLVTGRKIAQLHDVAGPVSRLIGAYTSANLTIPIPTEDSRRAPLATVLQATAPADVMIVAVVNDLPVWAGIPLPREGGTDAQLSLGCVSIEGYLDRRYVADHTFVQVDEATIMATLVGDAQVEGIGLTVDAPPTGNLRDHEFFDHDDVTVYQRLQELSAVVDGPEWTIDLDWETGDMLAIRKIFRVRPRLGVAAAAPNAVFRTTASSVFSSEGGSETRYTYLEDRTDGRYANHVIAVGSGQGVDRVQSAPARDETALAAGQPRWERRVRPSTSIIDVARLDEHATAELARRRNGAITWRIEARWDRYPRYGVHWQLGDDIGWHLKGHRHPAGIQSQGRAVGVEIDPQQGLLSPILLDPDSEGS